MSDREIGIDEIKLKDLLIKKLQNKDFNVTKITSAGLPLLYILNEIKIRNIKFTNGNAFKIALKIDGLKIETISTLNEYDDHHYENFMVMLSLFERHGCNDEPVHGKAIFYVTGKRFNTIPALTSSRDDYVQRLEKCILKLFI